MLLLLMLQMCFSMQGMGGQIWDPFVESVTPVCKSACTGVACSAPLSKVSGSRLPMLATSLRLRGGRGLSEHGQVKRSTRFTYQQSPEQKRKLEGRTADQIPEKRLRADRPSPTEIPPTVPQEQPDKIEPLDSELQEFNAVAGVAEDLKTRKMKACYVCGQGGHWYHECPERDDNRTAKASPRTADADMWEEGWEDISVESEGDMLESDMTDDQDEMEAEEAGRKTNEDEEDEARRLRELHMRCDQRATSENRTKSAQERLFEFSDATGVKKKKAEQAAPPKKDEQQAYLKQTKQRDSSREKTSSATDACGKKAGEESVRLEGKEDEAAPNNAPDAQHSSDKDRGREDEEAAREAEKEEEDESLLREVFGAAEKGRVKVLTTAVRARKEVLGWLNKNGQTPCHVAAENGHADAVALMVDAGADVNAVDVLGRTPLHAAASKGRHWILRRLVELGLGVDARDKAGRTALMLAAWRNSTRSVQALLALAASPALRDRHECTALHFASWKGHAASVQLLLGASAEVDAVDDGGGTALQKASLQGQAAAVRALLLGGADPTLTDHNRCSALHLAASKGHLEVVRMWEGGAIAAQVLRMWEGGAQIMDALLKSGADVDGEDLGGKTPLHWAAHNGHADAVGRLAEAGAAVDHADKLGATPLHVAALHNNPLTPELLIQGAGADVTVQDRLLNTAVHIAARLDHREVVEVLAAAGADLHAKDAGGWSALHWALHCNAALTAAFLRWQGCSTDGEPARVEEVMDVDALTEYATPPILRQQREMHRRGVWTGTYNGQPAFVRPDVGQGGGSAGWSPGQGVDGCMPPGMEEGWEPAPEVAAPPPAQGGAAGLGLSEFRGTWDAAEGPWTCPPNASRVGQRMEDTCADGAGGETDFWRQFGSDLPSRPVAWQ